MMPKKDGVEACREIMESLPDTKVIMLTAGAAGYLQKVAGMDQLLGMMKGAAAGEGRLPTEVVRRVFDRIRSRAKSKEEVDLTLREKEILVSFCRGMSYVAIAEAREVKVVTIRNAIYTIQVKLGVASKQEVVVWPCGTGCWMTDHAGGLRGNLAGPVRAMVRNHRHKLDEDKGSPGYIMARAKSQRQLERRQLA